MIPTGPGRRGCGRGCGPVAVAVAGRPRSRLWLRLRLRLRLRAGHGCGQVAGAGQSRGLATRVPFLTSTASGFKGATAGSRSTLPVVTSNSLP